MATETEASCQSCASDPNFAVICSFFGRFAVQCDIPHPTFAELQEMLEDTEEVSQALIDLHVKLLRKARKSFSVEKWERTLIRFSHSYLPPEDAWELERVGYKKSRVGVKLRLLKMLLDAQFDLNPKFKNYINKLSAEELREEPLGRDKVGNNYWCQFDPTANIRVYKEDQDEETWELIAKDREGMVSLITKLSAGENIAGLEELLNEDSNSQDIESPLLDTGQHEDSKDGEEQNEDNSDAVSTKDVDLDNSSLMNGEKGMNDNNTYVQQVKGQSELKNGIDTGSDRNESGLDKTLVSSLGPQDENQKPSINSVNTSKDIKVSGLEKDSVQKSSNNNTLKEPTNINKAEKLVKSLEERNLLNVDKPINSSHDKSLKEDLKLKNNTLIKSDSCKKVEVNKIIPEDKHLTENPSRENDQKPTREESFVEESEKSNVTNSTAIPNTKTPSEECASVETKEALSTDITHLLPKTSGMSKKSDSELNKNSASKEISNVKAFLGTKPDQNIKPLNVHNELKAVDKKDLDEKCAPKVHLNKGPSKNDHDKETSSDTKPALNLTKPNNKESASSNIKDYAKNQMRNILQRSVQQVNSKGVDLSSKRSVLDVTEEIKQRGALFKSGPGSFKGKGDGKSAPGSKLDEIFKLKRNLNSIVNHPESQPLPAHFVGTSKSQLLEKMRNTMNESYALAGFSETGKFTQPSSQVSKTPSKDAEDLSVNKQKRTGPEDLSVTAPKKQHLDKEPIETEVSEAIEEPVMLVKGEGSGRDCDVGNPRKDSENPDGEKKNHEPLKNEDCAKNLDNVRNIKTSNQIHSSSADKLSNDTLPEDIGLSSDETNQQKVDFSQTNCNINKDATNKGLPDSTISSDSSQYSKTGERPSQVLEKKAPKLWSIDAICSSDKKSQKELESQNTAVSENKSTSEKSSENPQDVINDKSKPEDNLPLTVCKENLASDKCENTTEDKSSLTKSSLPLPTGSLKTESKANLDVTDEHQKLTDQKSSDINICMDSIKEKLDKDNEKPAISSSDSSSLKDVHDAQPKGFFFGPGCVKLSNVALKSSSDNSKNIQSDKEIKIDGSPINKRTISEDLKPRRSDFRSSDFDAEETPPEPKKTKVTPIIDFNDSSKSEIKEIEMQVETSSDTEKHKAEILTSRNITKLDEIDESCSKAIKVVEERVDSKVDAPISPVSVQPAHSKNENIATKSPSSTKVKSVSNEQCDKLTKPLDKMSTATVVSERRQSNVKDSLKDKIVPKLLSDSKTPSSAEFSEKLQSNVKDASKDKIVPKVISGCQATKSVKLSEKRQSDVRGASKDEIVQELSSDSKAPTSDELSAKQQSNIGIVPKEKPLDDCGVEKLKSKLHTSSRQVEQKDSSNSTVADKTKTGSESAAKEKEDSNVKVSNESTSDTCKKEDNSLKSADKVLPKDGITVISLSEKREKSPIPHPAYEKKLECSLKNDRDTEMKTNTSSQLKEENKNANLDNSKSIPVPSQPAKCSTADEHKQIKLTEISKLVSNSSDQTKNNITNKTEDIQPLEINTVLAKETAKNKDVQSVKSGNSKEILPSSASCSDKTLKTAESSSSKNDYNKSKSSKSENVANKSVCSVSAARNQTENKDKNKNNNTSASKDSSCKSSAMKKDESIKESASETNEDSKKCGVPFDVNEQKPCNQTADNDQMSSIDVLDNKGKQTKTEAVEQDTFDKGVKSSLVGKVTLRNMSEILNPTIVESAGKVEPVAERDTVKKNSIDVSATSTKPISKISLKPLSQILKPEVIAQSVHSELQGNVRTIKGVSDTSVLNSKQARKVIKAGNETVSNKPQQTVPLASEIKIPSTGAASNSKEFVEKTDDKISYVSKPAKQMPSAKCSDKVKAEPAVIGNSGKQEIINKSMEQAKLESEVPTIAVKKDLQVKRNAAALNVSTAEATIVEVPLRNTRSRQRNTVLNSSTKTEKPKQSATKSKKQLDDDVEIVLEKDPLALSDEESKKDASKSDSSKKDVSLLSFSLEPLPEKAQEKVPEPTSASRKRRCSRRLASKDTDEDVDPENEKEDEPDHEESGGKRRKMKGKRIPDVNLRQKIEVKRSRKSSSSEEEVPDTFEDAFASFVSKKNKAALVRGAKNTRGAKEKVVVKEEIKPSTEDKSKQESDEEAKEERKPRKKTPRASKCSAKKSSK